MGQRHLAFYKGMPVLARLICGVLQQAKGGVSGYSKFGAGIGGDFFISDL